MATAGPLRLGLDLSSSSFLSGHRCLGRSGPPRQPSPALPGGRRAASPVRAVAHLHDLFVGVGVGLPCTVMECGDIIYRSTLPRSTGLTLTAPGVALALAAVSYLWATPGVAPGFFDMFVLAFVERIFRPTFRKDDFVLGKKLGEGAFGVVYKVSLAKPKPSIKVEAKILGEVQDLPKGLERENKIIQTIMRQLLFALDGLHSTGIVHRDIKPQNVIFSEGRNCRHSWYAAPEQYIMSTQTPSAPSAPVATALSPVLWQLNLPDRFDIYSVGLIFLQMAFPSLRTDNSLIQFNRQLKRCDYDLNAWRNLVEPRAGLDLRKGFELLDLDGGIGWELLTSMVRYKARQRTSAKLALAHPYFKREGLLGLSLMQNLRLQQYRATQKDYSEAANWVIKRMAKSGTASEGGFTEAQLQELRNELQFNLQEREPKRGSPQRNVLASILRVQRKIIRTLNESMDELNRSRKSLWWSRWIPREE
ncbi:hypothetical protein GW17_00006825 [Ensete ventricosum]|nr:hypothetical protein GW17_00006825 [Ensete ventricosum]